MNRGVRSTIPTTTGKRIGAFWLLLFLYCFAAILVAQPIDGKQLAMFIILFVTVGWIAMGLLLSFASVWWGLALTAIAMIGYFLLPSIFYIFMAILGGGGMIGLGLYYSGQVVNHGGIKRNYSSNRQAAYNGRPGCP